VRESAFFGGVALTERPAERVCGVWVLHAETGRTVAFLKFEDAVQEIFAGQALPGARFPESINGDPQALADSCVLPDAARAAVPAVSSLFDPVPC
jgi:hypothetical protein